MKIRLICALAIGMLTAWLVSPAFALIAMQKVTPDSKPESGMTVQYKRAKDGTYDFTITRFLTTELLSWPGKQLDDLIFESSASLEARSGDKLLAKTRVAAETKNGVATYTFTLARDCIAQSQFSLWESAYPKDETQVRRLFATVYQVDLADIDRRMQAAVPQHP